MPRAVREAMATLDASVAAADGEGKSGPDAAALRAGLQDIRPEDLFPGVSFTINEADDEDMPYVRPASQTRSGNDEIADRKESNAMAKDGTDFVYRNCC